MWRRRNTMLKPCATAMYDVKRRCALRPTLRARGRKTLYVGGLATQRGVQSLNG